MNKTSSAISDSGLILFPIDVISIERTGENFRLLYDVKGRFTVHRITNEEAKVCENVD